MGMGVSRGFVWPHGRDQLWCARDSRRLSVPRLRLDSCPDSGGGIVMARALGLDFGTTNTVLAEVGPEGGSRPIGFHIDDELVEALRSALCFWRLEDGQLNDLRIEAGPHAIRQFIEHPGECRFIQSFKTFAASEHFRGTIIYGKRYQFDDLLAAFLARTRAYAGAALEMVAQRRLVVGRPVTFAGAQPDAQLAL